MLSDMIEILASLSPQAGPDPCILPQVHWAGGICGRICAAEHAGFAERDPAGPV